MKIGIITHWESKDNYGQLLQNFALQKALAKMGHTPFLLRYHARWPDRRPFFRKMIDLGKSLFFWKKRDPRQFSAFIDHYLSPSLKNYTSISDLDTYLPLADAFIVGSDQVWNPIALEIDSRSWMLDFVPDGMKRIAFSVSFGRDNITEKATDVLKKYLPKMDFVSVREKSALFHCSQNGFGGVIRTMDPTFLIDSHDYVDISDFSSIKDHFAVGYFLNLSNNKEIYFNEVLQLSHKKWGGIHIIPSGGVDKLFPPNLCIKATIPEWLGYLQSAPFIITNSFHGCVFAIIMQKPFIVFPLTGKKGQMNDVLRHYCTISDFVVVCAHHLIILNR